MKIIRKSQEDELTENWRTRDEDQTADRETIIDLSAVQWMKLEIKSETMLIVCLCFHTHIWWIFMSHWGMLSFNQSYKLFLEKNYSWNNIKWKIKSHLWNVKINMCFPFFRRPASSSWSENGLFSYLLRVYWVETKWMW